MTDNPIAPTSSLAPRVAGLLAFLALVPLAFAQSPQTLQAAYEGAFRIGTAGNEAIVAGEPPELQELAIRQFNAITAENVLKAEEVNPEPGVYDFAAADAFVEFGEKHDMFIVGHTLIWHNQTPSWFFHDDNGQPNTAEAQKEVLRRH